MPRLDGNVNHSPHVVLLGAGASIASYIHSGRIGPKLPSMQDLIEVLELKENIEAEGFNTTGLNFEAFYDELSSTGKNSSLQKEIEQRVHGYFYGMSLPNKPTIYDYLILSLREKDIIATFNWDPFLLIAYQRNMHITKPPRICFLHGNVAIGVCEKDRTCGTMGYRCSKCGNPFVASKLLYPVKHKDYNSDPFIKNEWDTLRWYLESAYYVTVFGYSAPKTDVEAKNLMLEVWQQNPTLNLAEIDIIDIAEREHLEETWADFTVSHHYGVYENFFQSILMRHPRRSCDAFAEATLMCAPWQDNPMPQFNTLEELQSWVLPLIEEENKYATDNTKFSGQPCPA